MLSMDAVYYQLIKAGRRTIETIPEQHREGVQALLDADSKKDLEAPST